MNAADNPYYRSAISFIQDAGLDVDPLGPRDIYGELLDQNKKIMMAIKPLYEVFRTVDGERYPQMGFLYYMKERTKK